MLRGDSRGRGSSVFPGTSRSEVITPRKHVGEITQTSSFAPWPLRGSRPPVRCIPSLSVSAARVGCRVSGAAAEHYKSLGVHCRGFDLVLWCVFCVCPTQ